MMKDFQFKGVDFQPCLFGDGLGLLSVCCLNPNKDIEGTDRTQWPCESDLELLLGLKVKFEYTGDNSEHPEAIYSLVRTPEKDKRGKGFLII